MDLAGAAERRIRARNRNAARHFFSPFAASDPAECFEEKAAGETEKMWMSLDVGSCTEDVACLSRGEATRQLGNRLL